MAGKISRSVLSTEEQKLKVGQNEKFINWMLWLMRLLKRKNIILVNKLSCAYGKKHIPQKVVHMGGAYLVKSATCSGCKVGDSAIQLRRGAEIPKAACTFLKEGYLLSFTPCQVGKLVEIQGPEQHKSLGLDDPDIF